MTPPPPTAPRRRAATGRGAPGPASAGMAQVLPPPPHAATSHQHHAATGFGCLLGPVLSTSPSGTSRQALLRRRLPGKTPAPAPAVAVAPVQGRGRSPRPRSPRRAAGPPSVAGAHPAAAGRVRNRMATALLRFQRACRGRREHVARVLRPRGPGMSLCRSISLSPSLSLISHTHTYTHTSESLI